MLDLRIITKGVSSMGRRMRSWYSHGTLATGGESDVDEAAGVLSALLWERVSPEKGVLT